MKLSKAVVLTIAFTELVGFVLREQRKRALLSQAELAEKMGVDVSKVSRIESGVSPVTLLWIVQTNVALGSLGNQLGFSSRTIDRVEELFVKLKRKFPEVNFVLERPKPATGRNSRPGLRVIEMLVKGIPEAVS
jgi:transcriptional regulator with XRE-family HTH domain